MPPSIFRNRVVSVSSITSFLVGGAMGAFYICTLILAVPITGALTATAGVVLGQMLMALFLDRVGAFGLPVQEITWPRVAGLGLVLAGLVLSRL